MCKKNVYSSFSTKDYYTITLFSSPLNPHMIPMIPPSTKRHLPTSAKRLNLHEAHLPKNNARSDGVRQIPSGKLT